MHGSASAAAPTPAAEMADTLPDHGLLVPSGGTHRPARVRLALQCGFEDAVRVARADAGLLHLCGDAFLYTVAVHGLDAGLHMHVAVSFWDDAMQQVLRGRAVVGRMTDGAPQGAVARRLRAAEVPEGVLAVPLMGAGQVEAVVELGRLRGAFGPHDEERVAHVMRGSLLALATAA